MGELKEKSYDELVNLVTSLQEEVKNLKEENDQLKLVMAMKNARTFKPKNESIDKEEINLFNFNEIEANASTSLNEETRALETKKPRKAKAKNHQGIDSNQWSVKLLFMKIISAIMKQNLLAKTSLIKLKSKWI